MATKTTNSAMAVMALPAATLKNHPDQGNAGLHNTLHYLIKEVASMGVVLIAINGAELERQKLAAGHGAWGAWVKENCDYSERTASNYMRVWGTVKAKLSKSASGFRFEDLVTKGVAGMKAAERKALAECVAKTLEGEELIEVYRDLGIVKKLQGNADPAKRVPGAANAKGGRIDWKQHSVDALRFVQSTFDDLLEKPKGTEKALQRRGNSRLEAYAHLLPLDGEGVTLRQMLQRAQAAAETLAAVYEERMESEEAGE